MYINYNRLFNLHFAHDYYSDGKPDGLRLELTHASRQKLNRAKMLFKTVPNGVTVLYRALEDEVSPMVKLDGIYLTFALKINHAAKFHTVTRLDESSARKYRSSNVLYFSNDPVFTSTDPENPEILTHELIDAVKSPLFTYSFSLDSSPDQVIFKLTDAFGNPVSPGKDITGDPLPEEIVLDRDSDDYYKQQVDLRGKPGGKYTVTIEEKEGTGSLKSEVIYVDEELSGKNILGIVDLNYESEGSHLYGDTEEYELSFTRKETFWKYFIVDKNQKVNKHDKLLIDDSSADESDHYSATQFKRQGDAPHSSVRINGMDTVIFKSEDPIPFFEIPKSALKLKNTPGKTLIGNLPNPSHQGVVKVGESDELESEVYVYI
ncbi:MAG: hypothetical protein WD035_00510 [Balneolaceae bacterium]